MGPLPAAPGCDCQICRPEPSYDAQERQTIDTVLTHGWQVIAVAADGPCNRPDHQHEAGGAAPPEPGHEASSLTFAYTVGLGHRAGHPELLISGLDVQLMHRALNDIAGRVLRGRQLTPGDVLEDVLSGVPVVLEQASAEGIEETVLFSSWFHRRPGRALVVVWPTTSGIFPWQPGAPTVLAERQPPSWRDAYPHQGGVETVPPWEFPVPTDRRAFSCTHVVDEGQAILWVARESDETRAEDWSLHCGGFDHTSEQMRLTHLAHLVRSAPSVRALANLPLDHEALRDDVDSAWQIGPLAPE